MASIFAGKKIVIGVTGSIAAFKVAGWVSDLAKEEACITVVMTDAAKKFVTPLTFSALSGEEVHHKMFREDGSESMAHIELGRDADLFIIAPATANSLAKLAYGLADDMLSTTALAARCQILIFPAMNSRMYSHPATQDNIRKLKELGYFVVDPESGMMACKEVGEGRLVEWEGAKECIASLLTPKDFKGERILITAGPTREPLDPARFLSNRSSGKMGYALARCASRRGAEVVLISGPTNLDDPPGVRVIRTQTAQEMYDAVFNENENSSIIIKSAAVADFRPETFTEHKMKKDDIGSVITLKKNPDILYDLGRQKITGQLLIGFAAESGNFIDEGKKKFQKKNLDLIAVNDITSTQSGFEVDTNQVHLIDNLEQTTLPLTTKHGTANLILDRIRQLRVG